MQIGEQGPAEARILHPGENITTRMLIFKYHRAKGDLGMGRTDYYVITADIVSSRKHESAAALAERAVQA